MCRVISTIKETTGGFFRDMRVKLKFYHVLWLLMNGRIYGDANIPHQEAYIPRQN